MPSRDWLQLAKNAYSSSTTYLDANYRKSWENSLRMFQSQHPVDSKYLKESYQHRSKIFRPKSRSVVRKNEAAAAIAFFSNVDVISTEAVNQGDQKQLANAAIMKELINYRLTKSVPWFMTLMGAYQDAMTIGVVCSYQYWKYSAKKKKTYQAVAHPETGQPQIDESGNPLAQEVETQEIIEDQPCVDLIPIENIRIDPAASWIDPIKTSPYVIHLIPMYVCDVKAQMIAKDDKTGQPAWKKLDDGEIRSAMTNAYDSTRQIREGKREDSKESTNEISDYEIVWVHKNHIRIDNDEVVYYTLGTEYLLTDPRPLKEVYFHNMRPYAMGCCIIETHKSMPNGLIALGEQLQREANEIANQRLDNVKLVLNKRYMVKRGAQVDTKSLIRNVPASITMVNNPESDVREIEFNDVTSSSYNEQDRISADHDELVGNFSSGSAQTSRIGNAANDTLGGAKLIAQGASQLTEYNLRTFTESWVEPVLKQLIKLEQAYETDQVVLALAADRAQLFQKFGVDKITDELLNQELTLKVNVGMGATDPNTKLQRFAGAANTYAQIIAGNIPGLNLEEVGKEIFGLAGYQDGRRFLNSGENPLQAKLQESTQQAQQLMQQMHQEATQKADEFTKEIQAKQQEIDQLKNQAAIDDKIKQLELAQERAKLVEQQSNIHAKAREDVVSLKEKMMEDMLAMKEANLSKLESQTKESHTKHAPVSIIMDKNGNAIDASMIAQLTEAIDVGASNTAHTIQKTSDDNMRAILSLGESIQALAESMKEPRIKTGDVKAPSGQIYKINVTETVQ